MSQPSLHDHLSFELTRGELVTLARLVRNRLGKEQRRLAKSEFVPAEGHMNATEVSIERLRRLYERLAEASELDVDDGGRPSRRPK